MSQHSPKSAKSKKSQNESNQSNKGFAEQVQDMIKPQVPAQIPTKELFISEKTYKYPEKNKEGKGPFLKNGLWYGEPWCCFYWACPKKEPVTKVKCPHNAEHDELQYVQLDGDNTDRCNKCMRNMDEFFKCEECNWLVCLDCHFEPIPRFRKWFCFTFDMSKYEKIARDKANQAYEEVSDQTIKMFKELRGDDLEEDDRDKHKEKLFNEFDTDGSGSLQISELQEFLGNYIKANFGATLADACKEYEKVQAKFWREVYDEIDTDGDGNITMEEFKVKIVEIFEKLNSMMKSSMEVAYDEIMKQIDAMDGEVDDPPSEKKEEGEKLDEQVVEEKQDEQVEEKQVEGEQENNENPEENA